MLRRGFFIDNDEALVRIDEISFIYNIKLRWIYNGDVDIKSKNKICNQDFRFVKNVNEHIFMFL